MPSPFEKPVAHLREQLTGIRPGTLSVGFVETFKYNGQPVSQLAAITAVKDRIHVTPFDRSMVNGIAKAFELGQMNAYALNPTTVCVPIPPVSGEQRAKMTQHIKQLGENAKIAVRTIRQSARKSADDSANKSIQKDTDAAIKQIDQLVLAKIRSL